MRNKYKNITMKTKKIIKPSYLTDEALSVLNVPKVVFTQLEVFYNLLKESSLKASKNTHYDRLNEWSDPIYEFIRKEMYTSGFINGNVEKTKEKPAAEFWWIIYQLISGIHYSPFLKTTVSNHHASAFERNEALLNEIEYVLNNFKK